MLRPSTLALSGWALAQLLFAACLAAPVSAQRQEVTASAVMLREAGATPDQDAVISTGLRRGLRDVEGVRFVHPVDVLSTPEFSPDVQDAIDELEPIADMVRTGDARYAYRRAAEIAALFEENLERVRRTQLVDAYMLAAVGRCQAGQRRECESQLRDVIAFREGLEYDEARYGPETADIFARVRLRALSGGRGTLVVETEPSGAEIYVDGRSYGPAPARVDGLLAGAHYVTIKEIGHIERVVRAEVRAGRENVERYELTPNPRARLIVSPEAQARIRGQLGETRAGPAIRSLGNTLGTAQVIVGVLRPAAGEQVHVQLYLYHVHTRLLQGQLEATVSVDEAGMERMRQLTAELYAGVDLSGGIAAPEDDTELVAPQPEIYEQWWFWTATGGGLVAIVVGVALGVAFGGQENVPDGFLRFSGDLP